MSWRRSLAVVIAWMAVLSLVALLGVLAWASQARGALPRLLLVHTAPDGRVFVLVQDTFYVESPTGTSLEVIPLGRFEVRAFEGDFAVLSDNSILLKTERLHTQDPLQRCALKTGECERLAGMDETFRADSAFRLAVDERAQRIRVADTDHHRLLLLDLDGRILRRRDEGFKFPSSMVRVADGEFLVSDTFYARVVRISGRDDDTFGRDLGRFNVSGWSKQPDHTRPKGVALTRDGTRWLMVMDTELGHGELYRQGPDKDAQATLIPLPEGADGVFPEALGDSVLLPDGGLYRIHRFAADGTRLPDFGSPTLKARLSASVEHAAMLDLMTKGSYAGLLLGAVPMLILALWLHRSAPLPEESEEGDEAEEDPEAEGAEKTPDAEADKEPPAAEKPEPAPDEEEEEKTDVEKVAPIPVKKDAQYRNPETRARQLRGESLFQRRWLIRPSRDARRLGWLGVVLFLLLSAWAGYRLATHPSPDWPGLLLAGDLILSAVVLLILALPAIQTWRYERLTIDGQGLRYTSPFQGPLAFLEPRSPSWQMEWRSIRRVELKGAGGGWLGRTWYYELKDRRGQKRRIQALTWRLEGEDETGVTLRDMWRLRSADLEAVIRKTRLHRRLAEYLSVLR